MIDWDFIELLEGSARCSGYVPDAYRSLSGVTIATGVDLGGRAEADLVRLGLAAPLRAKLRPFLGLRGAAAVEALRDRPLRIREEEALELDRAVRAEAFERLRELWERTSAGSFATVPRGVRTVIYSLAYQYGDLPRRCPKFWALSIARDWRGMVRELFHFGDRYQSRRHAEAHYLMGALAQLRE